MIVAHQTESRCLAGEGCGGGVAEGRDDSPPIKASSLSSLAPSSSELSNPAARSNCWVIGWKAELVWKGEH